MFRAKRWLALILFQLLGDLLIFSIEQVYSSELGLIMIIVKAVFLDSKVLSVIEKKL